MVEEKFIDEPLIGCINLFKFSHILTTFHILDNQTQKTLHEKYRTISL